MASQFQFRRAKNSLHLPTEIIEEILTRIPVKSVLRFRCVSKSWRSLIDSRFFINKRLKDSTSTNKSCIYNYKISGLKHSSLRSFIHEVDLDPSPIDDPANNHLTTGRVVGSGRGLLCILKQDTFFVWNPTTRKSIELPRVGLQITKCGFGWEENDDAYKVFAVVSEQDQRIGKVYSSKTKSWKTVEHGSLSLCAQVGLFTCGKIHWLMKSSCHVESFDLKSEVFGMMEQPLKPEDGLHLGLRKGRLNITCNNNRTRLDLWVLKKNGEKESWVRESSTPIPSEYRTNYYVSYCYNIVNGVTFLPREKIIGCENMYSYVESLVSPDGTFEEEDSSEKNEIVTGEQVHETGITRGHPKQQNKRRPVRTEKKRSPAKKRRLMLMNKKKVIKEQEQVDASVAECRPKRHRRMPARYGFEGTEEEFCATKVRPRKREGGEEIKQERVHNSVPKGRPKRQNMRRPARYDT